jgi:hypothetical protein
MSLDFMFECDNDYVASGFECDNDYVASGNVSEFKVYICNRKEIKYFVEKWHYSKSINGIKSNYCFKLVDNNGMTIGVIIYGKLALGGVAKKYVNDENDIIELRRLCCIDNTPKNTESYFISKTIKYLKKYTNIKTIISYADQTYGHTGIVYKATNFRLVGMTKPGKMIKYKNKLYHDKTIRTKYKNDLKPYSKRIIEALSIGDATYIFTKEKYIYLYDL